jgi:Holliday junction resolvase RusA-like endonuclease
MPWCVVRLVIPGKPVPASRPRVARGHAYYAPKYQVWKEAAAWLVRSAGKPMAGPVKVTLQLLSDQMVIEVVPGPHRPAGLWGDIDNLAKSALDALVAGGVLEDDRMVTVLEVRLG